MVVEALRETSFSEENGSLRFVRKIYFGSKDKGNIARYPQNLSIILESTSTEPIQGDIYFLNLRTLATLKIKVNPENNHDDHDDKEEEELLVRGLATWDILDLLDNPKYYSFLSRYARSNHDFEALKILQQESGSGCYPLVLTEERKYRNQQHILVVSNDKSSIWSIGYTQPAWYAIRTDGGQNQPLEDEQPNMDLFNTGIRPIHVFPGRESYPKNEGWRFDEREIKVDVNKDPRLFLMLLPTNLSEDILLSASRHRIKYHYFILLDSDRGVGIYAKHSKSDFSDSPFYKGKITVSDDQDILFRQELTFRDNPNDVAEKLGYQNVKLEDCPRTPRFIRNKVSRLAVSQSSQNIFALIAERNYAEDGRPPLNQIEIEFIGKLLLADQVTRLFNLEEINEDFFQIRDKIVQHLHDAKIKVEDSQTTKFDWITQPQS